MDHHRIQPLIEKGFENRLNLDTCDQDDLMMAVECVLSHLDQGLLRVSESSDKGWITNEWVKKAILLAFRLFPKALSEDGRDVSYDKIPLKTQNWTGKDFERAQFRKSPGSIVRHGAFIGKDVVLMPSFVNIGAYVGEGTMIDTWATVGSCAQIGKRCHISGGVGIGGVLEPLQASPTIIEDDCFIGARSEIVEGVCVERGSVLSMGVFIGASTKIVDRQTGEIFSSRVPAYSVVIPGILPPSKEGGPSLPCAVIVKRVDEKTRMKTSLNELLRDASSEDL